MRRPWHDGSWYEGMMGGPGMMGHGMGMMGGPGMMGHGMGMMGGPGMMGP